MLEFYVSKNGELMSGQDKDLILQTSKGIDTIKVHLPEDYDDANIVASITFKNPKNVNSNEYKMKHIEGSKILTYLLDDAWFSSVKGTMQFTIRVYSTDVNLEDSVQIDPETGDIIADMQSKVQVFTKGSYQILEAVNKGVTPEIPVDDLEKIYSEITTRATKLDIYNYVMKVVGISKEATETQDYKSIHYRLKLVEDDLQDESDVIEIAKKVFLSQDKTIDIIESSKPLTIIRKNNIDGNKEVKITLPQDSVSVEMNEVINVPAITVTEAETAEIATKAISDQLGNVIDETYVKSNTIDSIIGKKTFINGITSNGIALSPSSKTSYDKNRDIYIINNDPYSQIIIQGINEENVSGQFSIVLSDGNVQWFSPGQERVDFYLKDLVMKETPVYKDIEIKSGDVVLANDTIPFLSNRNICCVYNNQLVCFNVISIKDNISITQTYGETVNDLSVNVVKIIKVGDLSE